MTAIEWFNLQSYRADKTAYEKQKMEDWKRRH